MPPSTRPLMGALAYDDGVTFRVWAPFAAAVSVAGNFNGWSQDASPLFAEGNGCWSVDEPRAGVLSEYKFVIATAAGERLWKNDPYARELTASGNSVVAETDVDAGSPPVDFRMPPWNELVIYELHVGTFLFDPTSPKGRGTFRSVASKLGYLRDLGINAIEIMASGEYETDTSWGYNPSYIFAIESDYGGPNGFRAFVHEAHRHGIAVVVDVVYNHLGPTGLDLWQFDGWSQDGHGGVYFYNDDRRLTPWGDTRPDYGRPEVRRYLADNAQRWLEQRYADALRWDATGWIRNVRGNNDDPSNDIADGWSLMQSINDRKDARQPWKLSIAEDMQANAWLTRDTASGGAGFDAQWDAAFVHPVRQAIIAVSDADREMRAVAEAVRFRYNGSAQQRVVYTESHDEVANGKARVPEEIWRGNASSWFSRKRSTLGAALVFTTPGIPMIFQGQEFLEDRWFDDRVELDWSKARSNAGIVALYRDLVRLRRDWFDHTRGLRGEHVNVHHVNDADKLIAYHRFEAGGAGDDVVVVANFANRGYESYEIGFPREGRWRVRFNSDWNGYAADFGNWLAYDTVAGPGGADGMPFSANIGIGPYTALILSQDRT